MEINSVMNAGLQGMQQSQQGIDQAADQVAKAGTVEPRVELPAEVTEQLIEMREQQLVFDASAEVVRTADKVLSKFIDEIV